MRRELERRRMAALVHVVMGLDHVLVGRPLVAVPFLEDGTKIVADLQTSFGRGLYRSRGFYVDEDFEILRRLLRPGDTFVDCGANIGQFCLVAARLVERWEASSPWGRTPEFRAALQRNLSINGLSNVRVLPYALGSTEGTVPFFVAPDGGGLSSFTPKDVLSCREIQVEVRRLDDCIDAQAPR